MKRFVISRLSALGDVACSLPAAAALKKGHPGCEVVWLVRKAFSGLVECCTSVDRVVVADPRQPPELEGTFDAALDLQGLLKSALVLRKVRARERYGYHWQREGSWLFSQRVLPDPTSIHIVDQYVDVARAAGGVADRAEFSLEAPAEVAWTSSGGKKYVVLNAGAGWATKRWPAERFGELADRIEAAGQEAVFIGSGQADLNVFESVKRASKGTPMSLIGKTNVRQLVSVIAGCSAHVGGDTGSTHIAAALGRPSIGLYALTRPERSCPYGQIERCLYNPLGLQHIEVAPVWEKLEVAWRC